MTDRTTIALAACKGMTDADLAQRGTAGFAKMIDRKRKYATAARTLAAAGNKLATENEALKKQVAALQAQLATLEQLDAPVTDTSAAQSLLAGIKAK